MRQEMLTARDQGRDEFAMPEQPNRAQGERVQARSHFAAGVAFLPGQGFISGLKVCELSQEHVTFGF